MIISLSLKQHAYLIGLLPNGGDRAVIKWINQVSKAANFAAGVPVDETQQIAVDVPEALIVEVHSIMGTQQERLAASMNKAIQTALIPQVQNVPSVFGPIQARQQDNATTLAQILGGSYAFLSSLQ